MSDGRNQAAGQRAAPCFVPFPSRLSQIIRCRTKNIVERFPEVLSTVTVEINSICEKARWHKLDLPYRTCPRALHVFGRNMSLIDNREGLQKLGPEERTAAAFMREGRERRDDFKSTC